MGELHVYTADGEEFVIAASPDDAAAVWKEAVDAKLVHYEDWSPTMWEMRPDDRPLQYHDDGTGETLTKTCGEWAGEKGRGYFASANY